jgi:hypothetical protein
VRESFLARVSPGIPSRNPFPADNHVVQGAIGPEQIVAALDERYAIMCRPDLHCAPGAHQILGTFPGGTVRLSPGFFTKQSEIDRAINAVRELAKERECRKSEAKGSTAGKGTNG